MPKSIRTTSNTQTPTNSTPATFKAGDSVLCPSVGSGTYTLVNKSKDCLTINIGNVECLYRADGRAYHDDCYVFNSDQRWMGKRWIVMVGVALVGWARARSDRRRARH